MIKYPESSSQDQASSFEVSATKFLLGTQVDIIALHPSVPACKEACYHAFKEIERIDHLLSSHLSSSEISRINMEAGDHPVKVSYETFGIIGRSVLYAERLDGLFDITVGPLTSLWGFNDEKEIVLPDPDSLRALLPLVDYRNIVLNDKDTTVAFARKGMKLDLGGIGKGYAIDRAVSVLRERGITNFLVNAGGNIFASGRKSNGEKWQVGIRHPRNTQGLLARFELSDYAVATSGDYERFAEIGGKRYHHIIDPKTGYPSNLSQSATVLAPTAEEADVLSTYLFIIGHVEYERKAGQIRRVALFVDSNGEAHSNEKFVRDYGLQLIK